MAYFLKCTQPICNRFRKTKTLVKAEVVKTRWLIFTDRITENEYKEDKVPTPYENSVINLDKVCDIKKVIGMEDYDEQSCPIPGTAKAGLCFYFDKNYSYWYYDTEEARDKQLAEIESNAHMYKSKVLL